VYVERRAEWERTDVPGKDATTNEGNPKEQWNLRFAYVFGKTGLQSCLADILLAATASSTGKMAIPFAH
jgi:hypothetical protein